MKKKRGTKKIKKEVVEKEEDSKVIKEQKEALPTVSAREGLHNTTDLSTIISSSLSSESSEENFPLDPMNIRDISASISASEFISSRRKGEIWDEICSEVASNESS